MSRIGWLTLGGFLIVIAAFLAMLGPPGMKSVEPSQAPMAGQAGASLVIPVSGVAAGELVDSFSDARGGGTRIHGAIDIPAPRGTPVVAAADGQIEKLFESRPGGHTIYQRSADGATIYYYAHLDGYAPGLAEGIAVRRGQAIAMVGSTGDANPSAPHLHFEVHRVTLEESWWQGTAIDPYPLLAGRSRGR